jgi:hypothetical protein
MLIPLLQQADSDRRATYWWLHHAPAGRMRTRLAGLPRFIVTPTTAKHRLFAWFPAGSLPSIATVAIATQDDAFFGVLSSSAHALWARAVSTQLREAGSGMRYLPQTSFETFPFPHPDAEGRDAIAVAARRLVELRDGWLNPPDAGDEELAGHTLTALYNDPPTWLTNAQTTLDRAVLVAYGLPADVGSGQILAHLLALNLERAGAGPATPERTIEDLEAASA